VIGIIVLAEFQHTIPQLRGFQQQQLNDYQTNLRLVSLMCAQSQAEHQAIYCDHIEFPDHVIDGVHTFVYKVASVRGTGHLGHQIIAEFAQMCGQSACADPLQNSKREIN